MKTKGPLVVPGAIVGNRYHKVEYSAGNFNDSRSLSFFFVRNFFSFPLLRCICILAVFASAQFLVAFPTPATALSFLLTHHSFDFNICRLQTDAR